eukprot:232802_1
MASRNETKSQNAIKQILKRFPKANIRYINLDLAQFACLLVSTKWVNDRCEEIINTERFTEARIPYKLQKSLSPRTWIDIKPSPRFIRKTTTHGNVLSALESATLYHSFMNHLSKEVSIECMLSLTEFMQFRHHVRDTLLPDTVNDGNVSNDCEDGDDVAMKDLFEIVLSPDIPMSWIVCNEKWGEKRKAYALYKKYIEVGSEFEINIASGHRGYYTRIMSDYDAFRRRANISDKELMCLFDTCCREMVYLMSDAMTRFQQLAIADQ